MNTNNPAVISCDETVCGLCGSDDSTVFATGKDYEYNTSNQTFTFRNCLSCGHVYLDPRPSDESLHLAYPSDYYTVSGRHTSAESRLVARLKSVVIRRRLGYFRKVFRKSSHILEVGCGDSSLLVELKKKHPSLTVTGLDMKISRETLDRCRSLGIPIESVAVERANLEDQSFDLIIMNQLIEHVADPVAVMNKLAKSLKPGGFVSIETPNRDGYDRRFFKRSFWGGYYFPRHLHLFDRGGLIELVERCGLKVVCTEDLLAPVIWVFSVHALLCHRLPEGKIKNTLSFILSDRNPMVLAVFTAVDLLARLSGKTTSNQKIIAVKPG